MKSQSVLGLWVWAVAFAPAVLAQNATTSIQVVNPDPAAPLHIYLDQRELPWQPPLSQAESPHEPSAGSEIVGRFHFKRGERHTLKVDVPNRHYQAQLQWAVDYDKDRWIVIYWYSGRSTPSEPPMVSFWLQESPYMAK